MRAEAGGHATPVLWHLKVSHYNEKVRWALDYKGIPHVRQAVLPGRHAPVAAKLTGGSTFPVLVLAGQPIGDSTRIIEALERRFPEPPLYPSDPAERQRALELETFFDEELGPYARLLVLHHILPNAGLTLGTFASDLTGLRKLTARAMFPLIRRRIRADFGIDRETVRDAYDRVHAAGTRFLWALGRSGYLVGDDFTVADLTAAAMVAPIAAPVEFPYPQPQRDHPLLAPLRDALAESGYLDWARDIYTRHRCGSAEVDVRR